MDSLKSFFSKNGVYLIAVAIFAICATIYCEPATRGKVVAGSDVLNYVGAANESFQYTRESGGKETSWWTGSMFCGMPSYQIGGTAEYKAVSWLKPVNFFLQRSKKSPIWAMFFYFACFYILLLAFGISPWISLWGALTIGLSTYFITLIPAGHNNKIITIALTAVVLAGYKLIFDKKYILGAILTMLFVAAGYTRHPQMFYYYMMMAGVLWFAELWRHMKEKRWKDLALATAVFAASAIIGVGTGCSNLLANREYIKESTRGGSVLESYMGSLGGESSQDAGTKKAVKGLDLGYVTEWSYGIDETMTLLIPGFKGGATRYPLPENARLRKTMSEHGKRWNDKNATLYWGPQLFTYGSTYVGAVVCFLFMLGLLIVKGPYKWGLLACTLFSIALSWGGHFMWLTELFYRYFPMYSKFRAVSSVIIVAEIAMPLLGLLSVKEILENKVERKELLKSVYISAGVTAGICLFFALAGGFIYDFSCSHDDFMEGWPEWMKTAFYKERQLLQQRDCLRSVFFIISSAALICLTLAVPKKKVLPVLMLVGVLSVADLWAVDRKYFNYDHFQKISQITDFKIKDYERGIHKDKDPHFRVYRVSPDAFRESRTSMYFKSIGGYSAVKLSRYNDLINVHLSKEHKRVIDMLNAKYLIFPGRSGNDDVVIRNVEAMGNAWFVSDIAWVDNPRDEIELIDAVDLHSTAVVHSEFKPAIGAFPFSKAEGSSIVLKNYKPNHLEYASSSPGPALAVFSEIYYPHGWIARIDGKEQSHFRADYVLRALTVPAGTHTITFDFDPKSVKIGDGIAIFFISVMYACIAAALAYAVLKLYRRRKEGQSGE